MKSAPLSDLCASLSSRDEALKKINYLISNIRRDLDNNEDFYIEELISIHSFLTECFLSPQEDIAPGDARKALDAFNRIFRYSTTRYNGDDADAAIVRSALTPPKIEGLNEAIKWAQDAQVDDDGNITIAFDWMNKILEAARQRQAGDEGE